MKKKKGTKEHKVVKSKARICGKKRVKAPLRNSPKGPKSRKLTPQIHEVENIGIEFIVIDPEVTGKKASKGRNPWKRKPTPKEPTKRSGKGSVGK